MALSRGGWPPADGTAVTVNNARQAAVISSSFWRVNDVACEAFCCVVDPLSVACRRRRPETTPLSLPFFDFVFAALTLFSYMSTRQMSWSGKASLGRLEITAGCGTTPPAITGIGRAPTASPSIRPPTPSTRPRPSTRPCPPSTSLRRQAAPLELSAQSRRRQPPRSARHRPGDPHDLHRRLLRRHTLTPTRMPTSRSKRNRLSHPRRHETGYHPVRGISTRQLRRDRSRRWPPRTQADAHSPRGARSPQVPAAPGMVVLRALARIFLPL